MFTLRVSCHSTTRNASLKGHTTASHTHVVYARDEAVDLGSRFGDAGKRFRLSRAVGGVEAGKDLQNANVFYQNLSPCTCRRTEKPITAS